MPVDRILRGPARFLRQGVGAAALAVLLAACWGTNSPTVVFNPSDPGGGGGEPTIPPRPPGATAAPGDGALLLAGAPTLQAVAPADEATGVDVRAVIALWFSESLNAVTANTVAVRLRPAGNPTASVAYTRIWLAGDRLLLLVPSQVLATDTAYEVVLTDAITDLDGTYYRPPADGVVLGFRTAAQSSGVAPRVLGSFPPAGSQHQPNDYPAIAVFSKPINFTGITSAVTLTNLTTMADGAYDRVAGSANRFAGDRVFVFPHLDDAADLDATIRLDIADTLSDVEFVPQTLQAPWSAEWGTLSFARPAAVDPVDPSPSDPFPPAANLANVSALPVDITAGAGANSTDTVHLRIHDLSLPTGTSATGTVGGGVANLTVDLTDKGSSIFLPQTQLVLAAYAERGERRTTLRSYLDLDGNEETLPHDIVPPVLFQYGPPVGLFGSEFLTDLPELRPYGSASEEIARIEVESPPGTTVPMRDVYDPSPADFWIGAAAPAGPVAEGPFPFTVALTDRAGNHSLLPTPGTARFRGFASTGTLATSSGMLRVVAFDRDTLAALPGAQVYVQAAGGGSEAAAQAGSDGAATFSGRSGAQTVTVVVPGYRTVTLHGSDSAVLSLPLVPILQSSVVAPVSADGVTSGILTVNGSTQFLDGAPDPAAATDIDLDQVVFGSGVNVRLLRPGWFASFHDVAAFPATTFLRLVGLERRVLRDPATGSNVPAIETPMRESMNSVASTSDYVYDFHVTAPASFTTPVDELRVLLTAPLPGVHGQAAVGAGAMATSSGSPNAGAELELALHGEAVLEGAPSGTVYAHVYSRDADQEVAVARVPLTVAASPAGTTSIVLPAQPTPSGSWTGTAYPYTRGFTDTLGGGSGMYRMVIRDSSPQQAQWHVWILAGSAAGGSFTLPTLATSAGGPVGTPPLSTAPGVNWRATVEAYRMPVGWAAGGWFFSELARDFLGYAKAVPSPALNF